MNPDFSKIILSIEEEDLIIDFTELEERNDLMIVSIKKDVSYKEEFTSEDFLEVFEETKIYSKRNKSKKNEDIFYLKDFEGNFSEGYTYAVVSRSCLSNLDLGIFYGDPDSEMD